MGLQALRWGGGSRRRGCLYDFERLGQLDLVRSCRCLQIRPQLSGYRPLRLKGLLVAAAVHIGSPGAAARCCGLQFRIYISVTQFIFQSLQGVGIHRWTFQRPSPPLHYSAPLEIYLKLKPSKPWTAAEKYCFCDKTHGDARAASYVRTRSFSTASCSWRVATSEHVCD